MSAVKKKAPKRKRKTITRNRPKRPFLAFVRLFEEEQTTLQVAAGKTALATFVREAALAYVAGGGKRSPKT